MFDLFYDRTARFGSVCGLYFETKPKKNKLCYLKPIYLTHNSNSQVGLILKPIYHFSWLAQGNKHNNVRVRVMNIRKERKHTNADECK